MNYLSFALQLTAFSTPSLSIPTKGHLCYFQVLFPKPFPCLRSCRAVTDHCWTHTQPTPPAAHLHSVSPGSLFWSAPRSHKVCSPHLFTEKVVTHLRGIKHQQTPQKTPNNTPFQCLWEMELFGITLFCTAPHTTNSSHCVLSISDLLEALFLRNRLNSAEIHTQRNF